MRGVFYKMDKNVNEELMKKYQKKFSNWGKWGPDDEIGTLNYVTPEAIVDIAKKVNKGKVFSLAWNWDENGPQTGAWGRTNLRRHMMLTGTDAAAGRQENGPEGIEYWADDMFIVPTHGVTHWDAHAHMFSKIEEDNGKKRIVMYNGYPCELVDSKGAHKCGIQNIKDKMVGRGVLLDIARYKEVEALKKGEGITSDDLEGCATKYGIEVKQGDFVLVRTGQFGKIYKNVLEGGSWEDYAGGDAPGLEFETIEWIYEKKIATIASDTWGVEVRPNRTDIYSQPWHQIVIPIMGLIHGEMFYLEELAKDCAEDKQYEFLLVSGTLPLTGGVGSPINPIAIK